MRMLKRRALSVILSFALVFGCFAGTGITAKAAGTFEIGVSAEELESKGGEVAVTVAGEELGDTVWWVLEKQSNAQEGEEAYEIVGGEVNTAEVDAGHKESEFSVNIPENTEETESTYRIRVAKADPYDPETDTYTWDGKDAEVTVAADTAGSAEEKGEIDTTTAEEEQTAADSQASAEMKEAAAGEAVPEEVQTMQPQAKIPIYHTIPPYQYKDVYKAPSVKIKGLPIEKNVDGVPKGKTEPYTDTIKFKIYDTTKQEIETIVEAKNGMLPDLTLADNHTYTIYSMDPTYKVVRDDGNTEGKLAKNAYIWVRNGKIYDIKENADYPYNYPVFEKIQIAARDSADLQEDERVLLNMETLYKNAEGGQLFNVKIKLVSDVETIPLTTGNNARIRTEVLEDVNYIIVVEDDRYDIEAFPLTSKDKSEYRTDKGRRGARYFYDHADCHQVEKIYLVDKKDAHKNDKTVISMSENTTVSGFNFKDFLVTEQKLSKSLVKGLEGKDYDVMKISTVNPHRWEVSKLAAGNFHITEKIDATKKVDGVYYIGEDGELNPIEFQQEIGSVSFTMNSMGVHPVVFEYNPVRRQLPVDDKQSIKVSGIKISGMSKTIAAGKKLTLKANVTPANAENKAVTWTSSNSKYAAVDAKGKVTAKKAGAGKTVKITATAKDGSGKQAVYQIKIMKHAVKSIQLKAKKSVKAGKKLSIKATVKTTGKKANKKLMWTSSNTKYATVNAKGTVTAKKAGKGRKVKITAQATDGSGKKKTVTIKIK